MKAAQHTSEKEKTRAAADLESTTSADHARAYHAPVAPSVPPIQRSTLTASMPGLSNDNNSGSNKRKGDDKKNPQPEKRQTRSSAKGPVDLNRPRLTFTSNYVGVNTQKQNVQQNISFDQHAVLTKPNGAPFSTDTYYDFRQHVTDGFASTPANPGDHAVGAFVQDGPFMPPYNDPNITVAPAGIDFHDQPGFGPGTLTAAGSWLDWYEIRFRWAVTRNDIASNGTWLSPIVTHRVDSVFNNGADAPVTQTTNPNNTGWDVNIP